jgi:hypothetical protein
VFSYYEERVSDQPYHRGDLLEVELVDGIDKKRPFFVPVSPGDSTYAAGHQDRHRPAHPNTCGQGRENAEGYIRADLARLFPDQDVVVVVYLKEDMNEGSLDTLTRYSDREDV